MKSADAIPKEPDYNKRSKGDKHTNSHIGCGKCLKRIAGKLNTKIEIGIHNPQDAGENGDKKTQCQQGWSPKNFAKLTCFL